MEAKRSTFALYFYINKSRENKEGQCPVYLRITVNNTQTAVSIKRSVHPENWDSKGFPKGKSLETKDLNNYINAIRTKLFNIQEDLMLKETCITADMFREQLFGTSRNRQVTLLEMFKERMDKEYALYLQGDKSEAEYNRYRHAARYLKDFLMEQFHIQDIAVTRIDRMFIDKYMTYLTLRPTIGHNFAMACLHKFKNILQTAIQYDFITKNPFYGISLAKEVKEERNYLTDDELKLLLSTPITNKCLARERDMFCFSVFTGLANIDVCNLTRQKLEKMDGQWWIRAYREKTKVLSIIPLLPQAEEIIRKYHPDFEDLSFSTKLLPMNDINGRNQTLKKLAALCGISKNLTTHVARHTFATTITLTNDVPLETVSKMLGHKNMRMTQHYAKIVDKKIGRDMEKLTTKISGVYQVQLQ